MKFQKTGFVPDESLLVDSLPLWLKNTNAHNKFSNSTKYYTTGGGGVLTVHLDAIDSLVVLADFQRETKGGSLEVASLKYQEGFRPMPRCPLL